MSEIDYERVQFLHDVATDCARDGTEIAIDADEVILYLTKPLLALRERAEPDYYVVVTSVGVWQSFHRNRAEAEFIVNKPFNPGYSILEIYTAPPAPVVPDALPEHDSYDGNDIDYMEPSAVYELGKTHGWNACRAAMLQPVSRPYKLQVSPQDESKPTKN
ncbi:hypothetical protein [Cronobacter sakazakii]|uniref:hypothetical protein n=1 Tax=Cronobacter sakazakii TaxID=28141 RepID=UPI00192A6707|nr:hypothetical protein [Cronobacter sakazakii]EGT4353040.1 hypothetical protein [Cronobacter sakazakii]EKA5401350.1 hypothetical protein [Cronobacter sakazakii]ELQ6206360.1 hypothetical protein [Cronobacter sakazakii]ELY2894538.1 hypothetical protein [Cronobacter sakazakii]ELY6374922.1 hypothetical protein [Cronobacter sakazakii]